MKRILLFLLLIVTVSAACKKRKKEAPVPTPPITAETLAGNWTDELPLSSSMIPATYSFRADRTYSSYVGIGPKQGTYQVNAGSTDSKLDLTLTETGNSTITRIYVEITSRNRMVVTFHGNTAGRPFVRVP